MKTFLIVMLVLFLTINLFSQTKSEEGNEGNFGIKIKGYIKTDQLA